MKKILNQIIDVYYHIGAFITLAPYWYMEYYERLKKEYYGETK